MQLFKLLLSLALVAVLARATGSQTSPNPIKDGDCELGTVVTGDQLSYYFNNYSATAGRRAFQFHILSGGEIRLTSSVTNLNNGNPQVSFDISSTFYTGLTMRIAWLDSSNKQVGLSFITPTLPTTKYLRVSIPITYFGTAANSAKVTTLSIKGTSGSPLTGNIENILFQNTITAFAPCPATITGVSMVTKTSFRVSFTSTYEKAGPCGQPTRMVLFLRKKGASTYRKVDDMPFRATKQYLDFLSGASKTSYEYYVEVSNALGAADSIVQIQKTA